MLARILHYLFHLTHRNTDMRSEYQFHESLGERDAHLAYCEAARATLARLNAKPSMLARLRRLLGC